MVKHLPTMQETWVQSLGWEDLLEKAMATHSSTLAWTILWMEEPSRLQSMAVHVSWLVLRGFFKVAGRIRLGDLLKKGRGTGPQAQNWLRECS